MEHGVLALLALVVGRIEFCKVSARIQILQVMARSRAWGRLGSAVEVTFILFLTMTALIILSPRAEPCCNLLSRIYDMILIPFPSCGAVETR